MDSAFDEVDRYFLALRVGSVLALGLWLWRFAAAGSTGEGIALAAAFVMYSLLLYLQVWRRPHSRGRAYLAALPADLAFLFLVCLWSAQPMSGVYLAFYLLVALHAFYFSAPIGVVAAAGFAGLYTALYLWLPVAQRCAPQELVLRLAFAFLIAVSLALVSRQLRESRRHLSEVNRQLQHRNRVLDLTYRHLSIGRLAGDVGHNINNPAAIIVSKADLLRQQAQRDGLAQVYGQNLATIREQAFRIAGVARSFLALSPQRDGVEVDFDLAKVVDGVVPLFENRAVQRGVRIAGQRMRGLMVHGQEAGLREVVVNLLGNAFDALDQGGQVIIDTCPGLDPDMVELRVSDTGHGIAAEHLDHIFSPFFTTKDGAAGVGLGLSISLTIVRRLGGTMAVDSIPGSGSTFTVTLPATARAAIQEQPL